MTKFERFAPAVHEWFKGLEADNSREHFAVSRDFFEESVRGQMEALLTELSEEFGGEVKMFRQNRDIRFSADKSPYKTNTYGVVYGSGIAVHGLYASISADGLVAGSGYHVMARDQLDRYRVQVADDRHGPELMKLVAMAQKSGLELWGESLATAPRAYPKDHQRIELLRLSTGGDLAGEGLNYARRQQYLRLSHAGTSAAGSAAALLLGSASWEPAPELRCGAAASGSRFRGLCPPLAIVSPACRGESTRC